MMARRSSSDGRIGHARAVSDLLPAVGGKAFRRYGFAQGQLLQRWRGIVGPLYARWSVPESLKPQRGQPGALLTIRVEGPFAPQIQHAAKLVIERCNRILGEGAVARIRLVQGAVPRPPEAAGAAPDVRDSPVPES
ncbi:MAG: DciA family protein, partial [Sphingomonadaceae bacterium]